MPGPVQVRMLQALVASPDGAGGFRKSEVSQAAVKRGLVRLVGSLSDKVDWYEITDLGRAALIAYQARQGLSR